MEVQEAGQEQQRPRNVSHSPSIRVFTLSWPSAISSKVIHIYDVTASTYAATQRSSDELLSTTLLAKVFAENESAYHPSNTPPQFTVTSINYIGSKMSFRDSEGNEIAIWEAPILSFGSSKLILPAGSAGHDMSEIKPLGVQKRGVGFVKNSVGYSWETDGESKKKRRQVFSLRKKVAGNEREIGCCYQRHGFERHAVMTVDERDLDILTAIVTCVALLKRKDSFAY